MAGELLLMQNAPERRLSFVADKAYDRRAGTDAHGILYQNGPASTRTPRSRYTERNRPTGAGDRMDRAPTLAVRTICVPDALNSQARSCTAVARTPGSGSEFGVALRAVSGAVSGLAATVGAILAWPQLQVCNAALEGMNNPPRRMKVVSRRAYGLSKVDTYITAIWPALR